MNDQVFGVGAPFSLNSCVPSVESMCFWSNFLFQHNLVLSFYPTKGRWKEDLFLNLHTSLWPLTWTFFCWGTLWTCVYYFDTSNNWSHSCVCKCHLFLFSLFFFSFALGPLPFEKVWEDEVHFSFLVGEGYLIGIAMVYGFSFKKPRSSPTRCDKFPYTMSHSTLSSKFPMENLTSTCWLTTMPSTLLIHWNL